MFGLTDCNSVAQEDYLHLLAFCAHHAENLGKAHLKAYHIFRTHGVSLPMLRVDVCSRPSFG